jgi:hypothetical protein
MKVLKSIGAVLAGFVAITTLSLATDALVYTAWGVPLFSRPFTDALFGLAIVYRAAWGVCGGWIAARLAPSSPMRHALVLGGLGLGLSTLGLLVAWGKPEFGPWWYSAAIAAIALPSAWAGGKLHRSR